MRSTFHNLPPPTAQAETSMPADHKTEHAPHSGTLTGIEGDVTQAGVVIGQIVTTYQTGSPSTLPPPTLLFDVLRPHYVPGALYDSPKRMAEQATSCQHETRKNILRDIRTWANSPTAPLVCWLSGPAGSGKSTVARTIAQGYQDRRQLAATFFFWRKTGDRDDIKKLVPTLAYKIAERTEPLKLLMLERLGLIGNPSQALGDKDLLTDLSLEDQLRKLLQLGPTSPGQVPHLVVIDGLDECSDQDGIRKLIEWLCTQKTSRFRFLLTSRPEHKIRTSFQECGSRTFHALSLAESKDDIRRYFVKALKAAWPESRRTDEGGPLEWPSALQLTQLVEKSEGLFVYAATAVQYICRSGPDKSATPATRLKYVLERHVGLDSLYFQVIEEAKKSQSLFDLVIGSLMYLRYSLSVDELSEVLFDDDKDKSLSSKRVRSALSGCHSILVIPDDNAREIRSYHASLRDFLTDESRSAHLFYAPAISHAQLMVRCFEVITRFVHDRRRPPEYALVSWYYHARWFLASLPPKQGSGGLEEAAKALVTKLTLEWVKSWLMEALYWAGVPYLIRVGQTKDLADTPWTQQLEDKLNCISMILEKVSLAAN
ncbi:hypothetical protein APHAL10511_004110 [Amanita phalloides]|nr:hypothetical protein APHAL10511_004110 [Amanita phalloides]